MVGARVANLLGSILACGLRIMEHLIFFVFEMVILHVAPEIFQRFDRKFQKRIDRIVPDLEFILESPAQMLETPQTIPPKYRVGTGICIAIPTGVLIGGIATGIAYIESAARTPEGYWMWFLSTTSLAVPTIVGVVVWWLYSGRMVLRIDGVQCIVGDSVVVCPWQLFESQYEPIWHSGSAQYIVPIDRRWLQEVRQFKNGKLVRVGTNVRASHCHPSSQSSLPHNDIPECEGILLMSDIYRSPLPEVILLLRTIARKLRCPPFNSPTGILGQE